MAEKTENVFEGSDHVLHGLEQQLAFWKTLESYAAEKQAMIPALTDAAAALRDALKRAKGRS